jgi:hypothetical protein
MRIHVMPYYYVYYQWLMKVLVGAKIALGMSCTARFNGRAGRPDVADPAHRNARRRGKIATRVR